jgi:hypothetical protein
MVWSGRVTARTMTIVALASALLAWPLGVRAAPPPAPGGSGGIPPATDTDARAAAKREFAAGDEAYAHGDFPGAAGHFEAAYRYAPHPAALLNAAQAWEGAKSYARAAALYAQYLREAPADAAPRSAASQALKGLAPRVAELDIAAPGLTDVGVDGRPVDGPVVYVEPGHHFVYGHKDDRVARSDFDVTAGSVTPVTLTPPPDLPTPPPVVPSPPAPSSTPDVVSPPLSAPPLETRPVPASSRGTHVLPPWVVIVGSAATAVGIAGTIWSGIETEQYKSTVYDPDPNAANLDAGLTRQRRTNILLGATAVAALATGAFAIWFVDWHGPGGGRVGLGALPSAVALRSTF